MVDLMREFVTRALPDWGGCWGWRNKPGSGGYSVDGFMLGLRRRGPPGGWAGGPATGQASTRARAHARRGS